MASTYFCTEVFSACRAALAALFSVRTSAWATAALDVDVDVDRARMMGVRRWERRVRVEMSVMVEAEMR